MEHGFVFGNRVLDVVFLSWGLAQGYKVLVDIFVNKTFKMATLWGTGGMPSSHSSTVTSLATSIGIVKGFASTDFAISMILAGIVMYDASGIRRAAGQHAGIINRLIEKISSTAVISGIQEEKLKELLGHTPFEVLVGALLGIVVAFLFRSYLI